MGSYSSVASRPASLRIMEVPPGCWGRNSVTSQTSPYKATQQSSGLLCDATKRCQYILNKRMMPRSYSLQLRISWSFF